MIEAVRLSRDFGGREAVREVSFSVAPGEVVAFLGPNGAGKTTTIRLLLGLLRPAAGRADVTRPVGYVPELFAGYDALAVSSYLGFLARMKRVPRAEVEPSLGAAAAADLAGRPVGRLSKGQRQRVGLAQALLGRPPSYVLDEPTQGLDPAQVVEARALLRSWPRMGRPCSSPPICWPRPPPWPTASSSSCGAGSWPRSGRERRVTSSVASSSWWAGAS